MGAWKKIRGKENKNISQPTGEISHMSPGLPSKFSQVFHTAGGLTFVQVSHQDG